MRTITLFFALLVSSASSLIVLANDSFAHSSDPIETTQFNQIMKLEPLTGITKKGSMERFHLDHSSDGKIRRARLNSFDRVASGSMTDLENTRTRDYEPPEKHLEDTAFVDKVPQSFRQINNESRNGHLIKIYDMSEKVFGNDRELGRVQVALLPKTEFTKVSDEPRSTRSVNMKDEKKFDDLEEYDTRDFQPWFSVKQEPAKRRSARLVEAYGLPKKMIGSNGQIERVRVVSVPRAEASRQPSNSVVTRTSRSIDTESKNKLEDLNSQEAKVFQPLFVHRKQTSVRRKNGRLLDAYRTPKQCLNNDERIGRLYVSSAPTVETSRSVRTTRSINTESKNGLEDLEGQDAKVFRPLFVYRQQVAARQRRLEEKRKSMQTQRSHPSHATTKPYVYRRPFY